SDLKPYGVSLNITPRIDRNGTIRSRIDVEASSIDTSLSAEGGPALRTRRASTEVNVRSRQTLILGGFLSRERSSGRSGLPLLQEIPLLGVLFSGRPEPRQQTGLALFRPPPTVPQAHPDPAARVERGRQVLGQAFPDPPPLGTAVPGPGTPDWSAHMGPGSQWQAAGGAALAHGGN